MGRIVGYLRGKETRKLMIEKPEAIRVRSFGDASYGDCRETRRSSPSDLHTMV